MLPSTDSSTITNGERSTISSHCYRVVRSYKCFYSSHPDHVDPPVTPSKVLMILRTSAFKGNPWWEKDILTKLNLEEVSSCKFKFARTNRFLAYTSRVLLTKTVLADPWSDIREEYSRNMQNDLEY